jgi:AraC-like DNA-binding protein
MDRRFISAAPERGRRAPSCPNDRAPRPSDRLMWITPDRVFYFGLLGAPSTRMMGSYIVYAAAEDTIRVRLDKMDWQIAEMAVVPPYVPHEVLSEARLINVLKIEAETVDVAALPEILRGRGPVEAPDFLARVRKRAAELRAMQNGDVMSLDFDRLFFDEPLRPLRLDRRIQEVIDRIKRDPSAAAHAEDCAHAVSLSFSRFLHLFKDEIGVPFRSFRSWKRARSLLRRVHQSSNLAYVALDTGYPDSSHFSHSIRQAYGLKPKDIFAGSRRLTICDNELAPTL